MPQNTEKKYLIDFLRNLVAFSQKMAWKAAEVWVGNFCDYVFLYLTFSFALKVFMYRHF